MEQSNQPYPAQQPTAPIMTVGNWIVTYILMAIPIVGIIMLIVWAASNTENPNRKNWAIAMLIMWAISIVLMIILWSAIAVALSSVIDSLR